MAPSDRESNSFSASKPSLFIGHFKIRLGPPFLSAIQSVTLHTSFFASASISTILAIGHWFRWQSSLSKTMSTTAKSRIFFFHICLTCRLWRNSVLHLLQNSPAICCTCYHLLFEYASGFDCKEVTWWKWYFAFWVNHGLYSEWSRVNDKLNFSHQCFE